MYAKQWWHNNRQWVPLELDDFYVYQIGRIICSEKTFYKNHYHSNYYELTIVTDGEGTVYTNNKPIHVKKGDIYFSCIYDIHAIKSAANYPLQYDFCSFYPKDAGLIEDYKELSKKLFSAENRLFHSNRVSNLCHMGINEIQNLNKKYAFKAANNILWQVSIYTYRILSNTNSDSEYKISDKNILCYQIMNYINSNIETMHTLAELSKEFRFSYNYLSSVFKNTTSLNIVDFYNIQRLNLAQTLIIQNELNLEKIAMKTNYSSAFALSKAFKRQFGLSPLNYKKRYLNNQTEPPSLPLCRL